VAYVNARPYRGFDRVPDARSEPATAAPSIRPTSAGVEKTGTSPLAPKGGAIGIYDRVFEFGMQSGDDFFHSKLLYLGFLVFSTVRF